MKKIIRTFLLALVAMLVIPNIVSAEGINIYPYENDGILRWDSLGDDVIYKIMVAQGEKEYKDVDTTTYNENFISYYINKYCTEYDCLPDVDDFVVKVYTDSGYSDTEYIKAYLAEFVDADLGVDRKTFTQVYYPSYSGTVIGRKWVAKGDRASWSELDVENLHGTDYKFDYFTYYDEVDGEVQNSEYNTMDKNRTFFANWHKKYLSVSFNDNRGVTLGDFDGVEEGYNANDYKTYLKARPDGDYSLYMSDSGVRLKLYNYSSIGYVSDEYYSDCINFNYSKYWHAGECMINDYSNDPDAHVDAFDYGWDYTYGSVALYATFENIWVKPKQGLAPGNYKAVIAIEVHDGETDTWVTTHAIKLSFSVNAKTPTYTIVYDYNGGTCNGLGIETVIVNPGRKIVATRENMLTDMILPASKDLDYLLVNGDRVELGSDIYLNRDMTIKYMWKTISAVQVDPEPTPVVPTVNLSESREERATTSTTTISWNKNPDAKGYFVYRKSGSKWKKVATIKNINTTTYTNKKLKAGTNYTYKISAYTTYKKKKKTKYTTISTTDPVTVLTAPAAPKASIKGSTFDSVKVGYKGVKGTYKYEIFRSTSKKGTYEKVGESTTTSYTDTGLKTGTTYYYKVRACNNYCGSFSKVVSKKPSLSKPGLSVSSPEAGKVLVRPSTVAGEDGYVIQISTKKNKGFKEVANLDVYTTEFLGEGFKSKKTLYFRVRAYRVVDGVSVYSAWSKVKKVKIK